MSEVENTPDLSISPEKVCYLILKAREFDAKDVVTDLSKDEARRIAVNIAKLPELLAKP